MKTNTIQFFIVMAMSLGAVAQANVATVNGKVITDADLNRVVSNLPEYQKSVILKDANTRKQLIQNLVDQEVLFQDASARKIDQTKEYKDALENFKRQTMVSILMKNYTQGKVTEAAARAYYNKNRFRYSTDQVHAQHILVNTEAEAKSILAEVKKPGVDFQSVAEKRSKDPSAKTNRGDVGFFTREMFDPAFSDAAFSAQSGAIVGPIKTLYGYHIIKIIERKAGKTPDFVEVEPRVRADLQKQLVQDYLDQAKRKSKIKM